MRQLTIVVRAKKLGKASSWCCDSKEAVQLSTKYNSTEQKRMEGVKLIQKQEGRCIEKSNRRPRGRGVCIKVEHREPG